MKKALSIGIAIVIGAGALSAGEGTQDNYVTNLYRAKGMLPPGAWFQEKSTVAVYKTGEKKPTIGIFKSGGRTSTNSATQQPDIFKAKGLSRPGERFQ